MPGFVGDIRFDEGAIPYPADQGVRRMCATLGAGAETTAAGQHSALGARAHDSNNGLHRADGVTLTVSGEIYQQEEVWRALPEPQRPTIQPTLPELLHRQYQAFGVEGLTHLNGVYAIALYDEASQVAHIVTDRTGFRWLYYWVSPNRIVFSTQARAISVLPDFPKDANTDAVYEMLAYGFCLDDHTLFKKIQLLPGGCVLTMSAQGTKVTNVDDMPADGPESSAESFDECVEEFARLFKQATTRSLHDNICVQPTGGFDSRSIAAMISVCRSDERVLANTMGPANSFDVMSGRKIARDLGFEHTILPNPNDYLERYGRESTWLSDGVALMQTCWRMGQRDWLRENGLNHITHGHLGFALKGSESFYSVYDNPSSAPGPDAVLAKITGVTPHDHIEKLLGETIAGDARKLAESYVGSIYENAPTSNEFRKCEYTNTLLRERRYIPVYRPYFEQYCRVHLPLADRDLYDFLIAMPLTYRMRARALVTMLARHAPRSLRAPHTTTHIPPGAGPAKRFYYRARGRIYYKVLPKITGGLIGRQNRNVYIEYSEALCTGSRDFVERTMQRADEISDLVDARYAQRLVEDTLAKRVPGYGQVYAILALIHWHELFRDGQGEKEFAD